MWPGAESPALHPLPTSRWALLPGGPLSAVEGRDSEQTSVLSSAGRLSSAPLSSTVESSLPSSPAHLRPAWPHSPPLGPLNGSSDVAGPPQGLALWAQTEGPLPALTRAPPLLSHLLASLACPFLLFSEAIVANACMWCLQGTLMPSWTCPLILSSGSESVPTPSLFPGGGKQTKNRFLPSLPPFLCPLILMKPGLLSLCLDLSGARGSHTAKPTAEAR